MQSNNRGADFLAEFKERGFYYQSTDEEALVRSLNTGNPAVYIGFDATATSLHVGSLMQIMIFRLLQKYDIKPIVLIGGGTTKVGDPSFKDEARKILSDEDIEYCLEANYGNITAAVQLAATCAYGQVSKIPIRERVGDVEVWNNVSKAYKDFLDIIIKSSRGGAAALAYLAKPYSAGISWTDLLANYGNPDVIKSSLALLETGYYNEQEGYI